MESEMKLNETEVGELMFLLDDADHFLTGGKQLRQHWEKFCEKIHRFRSRDVFAVPDEVKPLDMILHCPACGRQHIDRPDPLCHLPSPEHPGNTCHLRKGHPGQCMVFPPDDLLPWMNPVHRSHTCRTDDGGCGVIFRPADIPTKGVAQIKTRGQKDTWPEVK